MNALCTRLALQFVADPLRRAFLTGLVLGAFAWAIAAHGQAGNFGFAMSLVMIASGSASFVLHTLVHAGSRGKARSRDAHAWLAAIGVGVLAALQGLNALG